MNRFKLIIEGDIDQSSFGIIKEIVNIRFKINITSKSQVLHTEVEIEDFEKYLNMEFSDRNLILFAFNKERKNENELSEIRISKRTV